MAAQSVAQVNGNQWAADTIFRLLNDRLVFECSVTYTSRVRETPKLIIRRCHGNVRLIMQESGRRGIS